MNKKVLILTSLLAVTSLTGCEQAASSFLSSIGPSIIPSADINEKIEDVSVTYPDELLLNHRVVSVFVNEEYDLKPIQQFNYDGKNIVYECKNPAVATVDEKGHIVGVKTGKTEITAYDKNNPDLKVKIPVYVTPTISSSAASDLAEELNKIDETGLSSIVDYEMYEKRIYKNGELVSYDRFDQRMTVSYDDAYLRIWETDAEIKTANGSIDFTNYEWIFYTNAFFDTYVYHQTGDVKNYFRAATQSYMDGARTGPLLDILENIFVSGSAVMTSAVDNAKISKFADTITADYSNVTDKQIGSDGGGQVLFTCKVSFASDSADQDTESRYGIPYGTPTPAVQTSRYTVKDDRLIAATYHIDETYTIGEDNYVEEYDIDHLYEQVDEEKTQIYVPNRKEYTEVDTLFSV